MTAKAIPLDIVDILVEKPYLLVDVLPKQVPADSPGRYFTLFKYYRATMDALCPKFAELLIRLNCYEELLVSKDGENWEENFAPEDLMRYFKEVAKDHTPLFILVRSADALFTFYGDEHYMTLYNPTDELAELVGQLAGAMGLFAWAHP